MAGTSRIDELRKKFDENPRRYFAPLANEYRKIGDFDQAIFICQEFLPQQPGHMSGHIVYGQALFESGRHDEARSVFETALALDPENLIALRHLGDIARAHGDIETAGAWYRRVLESDPRNDEIAGILNSLESDAAASGYEESAAENENETVEGVQDGALSVESAISAATGSDEPAETAESDPIVTEPLTTAPAESSFDDIAKLFTSAAPSAPPSPAPTTDASDDRLDLIHEGEDVLGGTQGRPEEPPLLSVREEHRAEKSPESARSPEPAEAPPASFNLPFLEGLTSAEPAPSASAEPAPSAAAEPAPSAAAEAPPPASDTPLPFLEAEPAPARTAGPNASTAFVTETMAELYVRQGHHEQAIEVYRQLVQIHPNDAALAGRLRALETTGGAAAASASAATQSAAEAVADAGPTIREFLASIATFGQRPAEMSNNGSPSAPAAEPIAASPNEPRPPASAASTVGGSLHELFTGAEKEVPAAHSPKADLPRAEEDTARPDSAPLTGRPSKPAATELSLDDVFRHATPAAGNVAPSSFSFDQFFSEQAQQDVSAADTQGGTEESAGTGDDIQQFNAWLEGLKKS